MLDVIDKPIEADNLMRHAPQERSGVAHHVARSMQQFAAMRAEWDDLLQDSIAGVFNSWEWLYPWYARIGRGAELHILQARDEESRLVGLMPLRMEKRRVVGRTLRRLAFLGDTEVGSDYLDVVARRGHEAQVTQSFVQRLLEQAAEWDVLDLLDMDADSGTVRTLQDVFGDAGFAVEIAEGSTCPYETFVPGEASEQFLRRTRRYDNYVRRRKWLQKQPGYKIEITSSPGDMPAPLAEFMRLHATRWAVDGGSQGITGPEVEAFHRDTTDLLAEGGQMRLYTMWVEGKAVASVYGIVQGGKFIYYQSGRDPEWQSKSVGLVLIGETFRDAIEMGLSEYDFLRGVESYKSDWVTRERKTVRVRVFRRGGSGALLSRSERLSSMTRKVLKKALPGKVVAMLRRGRG